MADVHPQRLSIDREARERLKQQWARCFWFTGLPAAGKSTIANLLDRRLHAAGRHSYVLDGDNIRQGLSRDLDFTHPGRTENIRRVAEVARLMVDAGLIVIAAFISPFRAERAFARSLFEPDRFVEVFIDAPLAVCERRDPKGLYAKARSGALDNFTGYDSPYEPPEHPDLRIDTVALSAQAAAEHLACVAESRMGGLSID
jgi:bifunctional enzyme CysN/CysC